MILGTGTSSGTALPALSASRIKTSIGRNGEKFYTKEKQNIEEETECW